MPDSSSGNYSLPNGYLAVTGQDILASQHNPPLEDLGAAMSRRYMRDGRAPMLGNIPMNGYQAKNAADASEAQDYVTLAQVRALIEASRGGRPGTLIIMTGMQIEPGTVLANGQSLLRANFLDLYAYALASGNMAATQAAKTYGQYGPGDGTTTFTVPDLVSEGGHFVRPLGSGRIIGSVQADELKSHPHTASFAGNELPPHGHPGVVIVAGANAAIVNGTGVAAGSVSQNSAGTPSGSVTVNAFGGLETRPKNIAYPVLIKT